MKLGKKGQIVLFIFVSLVVALTIVLFFVLKRASVQNSLNEQTVSSISADIKPVALYIQSCLRDATDKNLKLASIQGGYVNLPDIYSSFDYYIPFGPLKVPEYITNTLNVPSEDVLKEQLTDAILNDAKPCIEKVNQLKNYKTIKIDESKMKLELQFSDRGILTKLILPTTITMTNSNIKRIPEYTYVINTPYYELYKIASEIAKKDYYDNFLSRFTVETISAQLPFKGYFFTFDPSILHYSISKAKAKLFKALNVNFHYIQLKGFDNVKPFKYASYFDNHFSVDLSQIGGNSNKAVLDPKVKVSFIPTEHQIEGYSSPYSTDYSFEVSPSNGNYYDMRIRLMNTFELPVVLPLLIFDFKYDVGYKVLVKITKNTTEQPNVFYFALPVKVKTNSFSTSSKPIDNSMERIIKDIENNGQYYQKKTSAMCGGGKQATFVVLSNGNYVNHAHLYARVAGNTCYLGETEDGSLGYPVLKTTLPNSNAMFIITTAKGYLTNLTQLLTDQIKKNFVTDINLIKLKKVNIEFQQYNSKGIPGQIMQASQLSKKGKLFISLSSPEYSNVFFINSTNTSIYLPEKTINYSISVTRIFNDNPIGFYFGNQLLNGEWGSRLVIPLLTYDKSTSFKTFESFTKKKILIE